MEELSRGSCCRPRAPPLSTSRNATAYSRRRRALFVASFARQPFEQVVEHPPAVVRYRLQRQREDFGGRERDFARAGGGLLYGVRVGVEVEVAERRDMLEVAEAVEQAAAQAEQRLPAERADANDERRSERAVGEAVRTAAFPIPGALGVQEGSFVMLGGFFGLAPGVSLALSLAKRVRELGLGIPGLIVWQVERAVAARAERRAACGEVAG